MNNRIPFRIKPMLATLVREPFHKLGWVYEEKYDGDRIVAYKEGDQVRMLSRSGIDRTRQFPQIAAEIRGLQPASLLFDGEVVVFDHKGISRFQLLQQGKGEPVYAVFDCLFREGKDLRTEPLSRRRVTMQKSIGSGKLLAPSRRLAKNGLEAYRIAKRRGYEGLVAKARSSPYRSGRSTDWLKVKVHLEDEFLIIGFTKPAGVRKYFGALLLGAYEKTNLRYVGKVGTGFDEKTLTSLYLKFRPLVRNRLALVEPVYEKRVTFLTPRLVAQISYQEWTADMKLRQPVFLGLRNDKRPREVRMPEDQT
ncbi:MAG TPA: non-homologous end-joining DNA ligase [Terriglobia bacterium]|nr:non-homologous end-joining DNA ligase [Terriglobia bacterium]